ncbi:MAG: (Fe-S)-binding protein [Pseudomonadota bacterium]
MSLEDGTLSPKKLAGAFDQRVAAVSEACVACGACFDACPVTGPAGLENADGKEVTGGLVDLLKGGEGNAAAARFAESCILSGKCLSACDYGVNPRQMLLMARTKLSHRNADPKTRRRKGVQSFQDLARSVKILSRMQLSRDQLARLSQPVTQDDAQTSSQSPDVVFYTGCNVLKTPHIALLSLDILDHLAISYQVLGGPSHCCGILQTRAGDMEGASRMGAQAIERFQSFGTREVISWCPSCHVQFTETHLPNQALVDDGDRLSMTPFMLFLASRLDRLKAYMTQPVEMRIALHAHRGVDGVPDAARTLLRAVPGVEVVDLQQPEVGLMSNSLRALPDLQRQLHRDELEAASAAGIDALVAVYHADHRELCAHERDYPFAILNVLEIIAAGIGLHQDDHYKRLKLKQDVETILLDVEPRLQDNGVRPHEARAIIESALLGDQPLPLKRD